MNDELDRLIYKRDDEEINKVGDLENSFDEFLV